MATRPGQARAEAMAGTADAADRGGEAGRGARSEANTFVPDQRTITLVNVFVAHTVELLNSFALTCDAKLSDIHRRVQSLEKRVCIIEAQLPAQDEGSSKNNAQAVCERERTAAGAQDSSATGAEAAAAGSAAAIGVAAAVRGSMTDTLSEDQAAQSSTGDARWREHRGHGKVGKQERVQQRAQQQHQSGAPAATVEAAVAAAPSALSKSMEAASGDPRLAKYHRMLRVGIPAEAVRNQMQLDGLDPDMLLY